MKPAKDPWQRTFDLLSSELVPRSGQAQTVQGELLRAIGKISDEAFRNGNINWDDGFQILSKFLRNSLMDPDVFQNAELAQIDRCMDSIDDWENPDLSATATNPYYLIAEKVVHWCLAHTQPIPRILNPALLR